MSLSQPLARTDRVLPHLPGLDGLRGLAVLAVVAYHLGLSFAPRGGAVGVTLFFTLSGFLITTLLLRETARSGGVRLPAFFARRALRLVPALLVLLLAVVAYARWWAPAASAERHLGAVPYTLLYVANWRRATEGFDSMGLLEHTWTLAVEEQFYLAWPLTLVLLLALARRRGGDLRAWRRSLLVVALVGSVAPLLLRLALWESTQASAARVLNGTDTAADPIMMGCALAVALDLLGGRHGTGVGARRLRRALGVAVWPAGTLLVVEAVVRLDGRDPALVPLTLLIGPTLVGLAGTVVIGWAVLREPAALSWRPLRAVGVVSYGLYLWHYPVIMVLREQSGSELTPGEQLVAVAVSAALTVASYVVVERPALRLRRFVVPGRAPTAGPREHPVPVLS